MAITANMIRYAIAVPKTRLTPFSSSLLTIPLSKNTKTQVHKIMATGVARISDIASESFYPQ